MTGQKCLITLSAPVCFRPGRCRVSYPAVPGASHRAPAASSGSGVNAPVGAPTDVRAGLVKMTVLTRQTSQRGFAC
jgi:hypothetical protein